MKPCIALSFLAAIGCYTFLIFVNVHATKLAFKQVQQDRMASDQTLREISQRVKDSDSQIAVLQSKLAVAQEALAKERALLQAAQDAAKKAPEIKAPVEVAKPVSANEGPRPTEDQLANRKKDLGLGFHVLILNDDDGTTLENVIIKKIEYGQITFTTSDDEVTVGYDKLPKDLVSKYGLDLDDRGIDDQPVPDKTLALVPSSPPPPIPAKDPSPRKTSILTWNSDTEPSASIGGGGGLQQGSRFFKSRREGEGSGSESFKILSDPTSSGGKVLHYLVTSQENGHKARAEHYLHIEPLNTTFDTEFSIKLDPEFTEVLVKRPDNGMNWCCLRQWHQGISISPPLALEVKPGTKDEVAWSIIYGDAHGHGGKHLFLGEKKYELDHWYHYRVRWNISPDEHGECVVMMSETKLPKDLTDSDIVVNYHGPIGYKVHGWNEPGVPIDGSVHAPNTVREQQGIYQGPHADPASHHGISIDNVAIYQAENNEQPVATN